MNSSSREHNVQVTNPDPFAKPVLRSPVLHTPLWVVAAAQLSSDPKTGRRAHG